MIKLGVRAHDYGKDKPEKLFSRIRADGFSCVQLAPKKAIAGIDRIEDATAEALNGILKTADEYKINIAVLGAYLELALADEKERKKNVAEFEASILMAHILGADCIATETTHRSLQPQVTRKEAMDALLRSLYAIMPVAEEHEVTVAIEPVATHTVNTPECAAELLKTIRSPYLKIVFDPVNLLTPENVGEQDRLWRQAFECFGQDIRAVHIKGVQLDGDNQLVKSSFQDSLLNYQLVFDLLRGHSGNLGVLREEIDPKDAKSDYAFMRALCDRT